MANDERNASLEDIDRASIPDQSAPDKRAKKELHYLAHEAAQFQRELGWLGNIFGGKSEKPGNISAIVLIWCFICLAIVYLRPPGQNSGLSVEHVFAGILSIVTLVLGYLFGSNDRSDK